MWPPLRVARTCAWLAIAGVVIAAAEPSIQPAPRQRVGILELVVDRSGSTSANDLAPTRLGAIQQATLALLDRVPERTRVGLVAFSDKAATLVRVCRTLDLERLTALETPAVATRLERERGLGPWSVGVVFLEGLGRYDRGLVGDLGLIKLCSALYGRWADAADTEELLAPYAEWGGLASVYLLAGFARGLLPIPAGGRRRARTRIAA